MGCGKSSVGKRLSELLCCRFMDLDEVIVERAGRSIPEIFAEDGEGEFRRMEKEALKDVLETDGRVLEIPKTPALVTLGHPLAGGGMSSPSSSTPAFKLQQELPSKNNPTLVLALGGGAVMQEECGEMVHSGTLCIYLRASVETLVERLTGEAVGRPLIAGADSGKSSQTALRTRILELMAARSETYERVAHIIIDTDGKSIDEVAEEIEIFRQSPSTR